MKPVTIALLALLLLLPTVKADEGWEWTTDQVDSLAQRAEATVKHGKESLWNYRRGLYIADSLHDPEKTGLIGIEYSELTTTMGYEQSKELSAKVGWASWLVRQLAGRGIGPKSKVAVGMTGSFPGINFALFAALQELGADVRCISSIGASSWGANEIGFSWPELERFLIEEGVLRTGSGAVTLGGTGDRGAEWDDYSMGLAMSAVNSSRLPLIKPLHLTDAVTKRLRFYGYLKDYDCYINVGGGHASLGGGAKLRFDKGGWFTEPMAIRGDPDGMMDWFLKSRVPCLNLLFLKELNLEHKIVRPTGK